MIPRIKLAYQILGKKMAAKKPFTMAEVLLEAGYSEGTSKTPNQVTESKTWKRLVARYPDEPLLDKTYLEAMGEGRDALENRKLFFKIKGRLKDSVSLDINKERAELFEDESGDESGDSEEDSEGNER